MNPDPGEPVFLQDGRKLWKCDCGVFAVEQGWPLTKAPPKCEKCGWRHPVTVGDYEVMREALRQIRDNEFLQAGGVVVLPQEIARDVLGDFIPEREDDGE